MYIIETEHLQFGYKGTGATIQDLSLSIPQGSIYGFLGHNGAGKSTTIRLLLGLLQPSSGAVRMFGKTLATNRAELYSRSGALIESPSIYEHLTARENLRIAAVYRGIAKFRTDEVLEMVGLEKEHNKQTRAFSTGMKQRLGLALALLHNPELLILDEPTNGLDPQGIVEMRNVIQRLNRDFGKTIFLSSHLLSEIELICSHVGIIKKGRKLFEGSIQQLQQSTTEGIRVMVETDDLDKTNALLLPKFQNTYRNGKTVNLTLQNKEQIPEIAAHLVQNQVKIYEMKVVQQSLEDLFLHINE
jgi:lantibiotic transport system ATP-binding protein